jgi:hypothetical protein
MLGFVPMVLKSNAQYPLFLRGDGWDLRSTVLKSHASNRYALSYITTTWRQVITQV